MKIPDTPRPVFGQNKRYTHQASAKKSVMAQDCGEPHRKRSQRGNHRGAVRNNEIDGCEIECEGDCYPKREGYGIRDKPERFRNKQHGRRIIEMFKRAVWQSKESSLRR